MPCNSDHLKATNREAELQLAAQLCVFVAEKTNQSPLFKFQQEARNYYAEDVGQTEWLCEAIRNMDEDELDRIVYNGRDTTSRTLADWWEAHQEADRQREAAEAIQAKSQALRESGLAKLTRAEKEALGICPSYKR